MFEEIQLKDFLMDEFDKDDIHLMMDHNSQQQNDVEITKENQLIDLDLMEEHLMDKDENLFFNEKLFKRISIRKYLLKEN